MPSVASPPSFRALALAGTLSLARLAGADDPAPPGHESPVVPGHVRVPDSTLALPAFERAVLERNPSLAAMAAAVREARAQADLAGALEHPMARATVAPESFGSSRVDAGWRVELEQAIPVFGQRGLRRAAARADADAQQDDFERARLDLVREARDAYFDYYHYEQVRRTALEQVHWMRQARGSALARYAAGTGPEQDVLAADVEIAMLDHQAVVAERSRHVTEARLRALLHADPGTPLPHPPDTLAVPAHAGTMSFTDRTVADAPEVRAAEALVRADRTRLALSRRERLPEPRVGVAYDRYWEVRELRPSLTATFDVPIAPGRRAASVRAAQAALDVATARREAARDEVARRLTEATTQFEETLHELEVLRDGLLPAAERSLRSARAGYEAGHVPFVTVIQAERDVAAARLDYHRTLAASNQARADLDRALSLPAPEVAR